MKKKADQYQRLSNEEYTNLQFRKPKPQVPTKAIVLACILFMTGSVMLLMASLIFSGVIEMEDTQERRSTTIVLFVIGSLLFIPGLYHVRIAYYAYKGYKGYSYEDIPEFE